MHHTLGLTTYKRCLTLHSSSYASRRFRHSLEPPQGSPSWETAHVAEVEQRAVISRAEDIDSFSVALEFHQAHNRESIFRRVRSQPKLESLLHLPPGDYDDDLKHLNRRKAKYNLGGAENHTQLGASDPLQYQQTEKERDQEYHLGGYQRKEDMESKKLLEYKGVPCDPIERWKLHVHSKKILQRPWLAYMKNSSDEKSLQFVIPKIR